MSRKRLALEKSWFRDPSWNESGYRFLSLGQDGTGGEFALWFRSNESSAAGVVFFGSEGGSGVLAPSARAFVRALAYAPLVIEYPGEHEPALLQREHNWSFSSEDPAQTAATEKALASYRRAVEARFGELPPFEALIAVLSIWKAVILTLAAGVSAQAAARAIAQAPFAPRSLGTVSAVVLDPVSLLPVALVAVFCMRAALVAGWRSV